MWPPIGLRAGPWQLEAPPSSCNLGMYVLPTIPTLGAIFKDAALREECVVETIWTLKPVKASI